MSPRLRGPYAAPRESWAAWSVSVLVRDGDDMWGWEWRHVGTHESPERPVQALREWLLEHDPPPGQYRAVRDDGAAVQTFHDPGRAWQPA